MCKARSLSFGFAALAKTACPAHSLTQCLQSSPACPAAMLAEQCARGSLRDLLRQARSDAELAAELSWPQRLAMALEAAKVSGTI